MLRSAARLLRTRLILQSLECREVPAFFAGGASVATGDINGDGYLDALSAAGPGGGPHVLVHSGLDGTVLRSFMAYDPAFTGGVSVTAGDVDGDGFSDIITGAGAGGGPHVRAISGRTGEQLASFFAFDPAFRGGVNVAAGDVDGDGRADIIVGAGAGGGPHVRAISGRTGEELASFFAFNPAFTGGVSVAAGDLDGDGRADFVLGAGPGGGPHVRAIGGVTGDQLANLYAFDQGFHGGVNVAAGDLDGDGTADIIAGAGAGASPHVVGISGETGGLLLSLLAYSPAFRGGVHVTAGDFAADGSAELMTGAGPGGSSQVVMLDGGSGQLFASYQPFAPYIAPGGGFSSAAIGERLEFARVEGLAINAETLLTGSDEKLQFEATVPDGSVGGRVRLFTADAAGQPVKYLTDLFDDGESFHGDSHPFDGIYSTSFAVKFDTAGTHRYVAIADRRQDRLLTAEVEANDGPSDIAIGKALASTTAAQTKLSELIASGNSIPVSPNRVRVLLLADPTVQPSSLTQTERGLFWTDVGGLAHGALATVGVSREKGAPPASSTDDLAEESGGFTLSKNAPASVQGTAIALAPFLYDFGGENDETNDIGAQLVAAGYTVTQRYNTTKASNSASVAMFKNIGKYDAIVIGSHGEATTADTNGQCVILTNESAANLATQYKADWLADRLIDVAGSIALTPAFFSYYSGTMTGAVVYLSACRSAYNTTLAKAFLDLGAAAVAGYSDYVDCSFAMPRGIGMFTHLLAGKTVGTIPKVGTVETDSDPAKFRLFRPDAAAKLVPVYDLLKDSELVITYSWGDGDTDLDTATRFLGLSVGVALGSVAPYLKLEGDIFNGEYERVRVDLSGSHDAAKWTTSTSVALRAGWYEPQGIGGPAVVDVQIYNKKLKKTSRSTYRIINPGHQTNGPATAVVGLVSIAAGGDAGSETVSFGVT